MISCIGEGGELGCCDKRWRKDADGAFIGAQHTLTAGAALHRDGRQDFA
jgi:hypothetical protein